MRLPFRTELQRKDLAFAVDACKGIGLYLLKAASAWQVFITCIAEGDSEKDHNAALETLEAMADHELEKTA